MARHGGLFALILGALVALSLVACGTTRSSSGAPGSSGSSGGVYGSSGAPAATSTPNPGGQSAALIATRMATVAGTSETILTNAQGMTLYYFTLDTPQKVACASGCISFWPPLLASAGAPTASASLAGTLGVLNGANGKQVTYNGHPLYTFANDKAPGDTHGEGIMGEWHVATPSLAVAAGNSTAPQATPTSSGGYGSGYGG